MDLTGQVALITRGSRGLGRAFAQALAAIGAQVAITGRTSKELHETGQQISPSNRPVLALPADVIPDVGPPAFGARRQTNPGAATRLSPSQQAHLAALLDAPAADGAIWTGPKVAAWISEHLGRPVHP